MADNSSKRQAALLVMIVFLLGIALGGFSDHLWGSHIWARGQRPGRDALLNQLTQELQLSADQQKQLASIVDDTRSRWHALDESIRPEHERIRQESRDKIRAVLTPEQKPKFEDFLRRLDEQRKRAEAQQK
ncbi:MAG: hypothetical protein ACRD50_14255 [Candidatus Acidiferrales bacterium]